MGGGLRVQGGGLVAREREGGKGRFEEEWNIEK